MVKEFILQLPPDKLSPFAKHPYQVREDAAMDELVESVRTYGILWKCQEMCSRETPKI